MMPRVLGFKPGYTIILGEQQLDVTYIATLQLVDQLTTHSHFSIMLQQESESEAWQW
jgi:hypothetical protein